jgi:hypothetical protein
LSGSAWSTSKAAEVVDQSHFVTDASEKLGQSLMSKG